MERERTLAGQSPLQFSETLVARVANEPAPVRDEIPHSISVGEAVDAEAARMVFSQPRFAGLQVESVMATIANTCRQIVPVTLVTATRRMVDVVAYALWRFTSAAAADLAEMLGIGKDRFDELLLDMRRDRAQDPAWKRLLWAIEWALRWQLLAGPHRP
jgi:hypothetical protein